MYMSKIYVTKVGLKLLFSVSPEGLGSCGDSIWWWRCRRLTTEPSKRNTTGPVHHGSDHESGCWIPEVFWKHSAQCYSVLHLSGYRFHVQVQSWTQQSKLSTTIKVEHYMTCINLCTESSLIDRVSTKMAVCATLMFFTPRMNLESPKPDDGEPPHKRVKTAEVRLDKDWWLHTWIRLYNLKRIFCWVAILFIFCIGNGLL